MMFGEIQCVACGLRVDRSLGQVDFCSPQCESNHRGKLSKFHMEDRLKDGRLENFIPTSKAVTVSMTLADYEAERKRCRDQGHKMGLTAGQRNMVFIFDSIRKREYSPEVIVQNDFSKVEFEALLEIARELYGD